MVEPLRPSRGGFLRPFGCGWFIREFLLGHGPNGSPRINPNVGAPQADIFFHYKTALLKAIALDEATRRDEKQARCEKRTISPEEIERLTERYLARIPYKSTSCRYHSFVVYFSNLQRLGWVETIFSQPSMLLLRARFGNRSSVLLSGGRRYLTFLGSVAGATTRNMRVRACVCLGQTTSYLMGQIARLSLKFDG